MLLLEYGDGRIQGGVVLSLSGAVLRIAIVNSNHVIDFTLTDGIWMSEDCGPVTFAFLPEVFQAVELPMQAEADLPCVPDPSKRPKYVN